MILLQRVQLLRQFAVQSAAVPEVAGVVPSDVWLPKAAAGEDLSWFKWTTNYLGAASPQGRGNKKGIIADNMTASLTSHVLWTRTLEDGGMVGGDRVGVQGNAFYMGLAYSMRFLKDDTLLLDGRLYYREPVGNTGTSTGYVVVDVRNGKELFRRADITALDEAYSCNGVHLIFGSANFGTPRDPASLGPYWVQPDRCSNN